uniref:rho GTPase-activating protein 32-like n=1 Tax=Myxine glutinosa TaxID=7769 RepID=UPI00358E3990
MCCRDRFERHLRLTGPAGQRDEVGEVCEATSIRAEQRGSLDTTDESIMPAAPSTDGGQVVSDGTQRTSTSPAGTRSKSTKRLAIPKGHFPRLVDCAHFHYDTVDFGAIQLSLVEDYGDGSKNGLECSSDASFCILVICQGRNWVVRRSWEDLGKLDSNLHVCIYDRRFSCLPEIGATEGHGQELLSGYLTRLSAIADNKINCAPVLTWLEIDNKGNRLLVNEESSINVPAIGAAHVIKRYAAQAPDELSLEVGNMVSVIDMPPKGETTWWRGKHEFHVGLFPSECVRLIGDGDVEAVVSPEPPLTPVSRKHGKLRTFLRSFMRSRPSKQRLRQRGILRERVFGCDLGELLLNYRQDVPQVVQTCTEFIERHGVVDGIYRLSGVTSNIQRLRHEFDSERVPDLSHEPFLQDVHSVGSLCKLYFRELPNPLLTYQLYTRFSEAVSAPSHEEKLMKIHDVIQQLPPPHYRTLEFLLRHLSSMASHSSTTSMHSKNLAIVWAPNLLRSLAIESSAFSGASAFSEVRTQSVVVEFLLSNCHLLFSNTFSSVARPASGRSALPRPKSLMISTNSAKLLSLEEARARNPGRSQASPSAEADADTNVEAMGSLVHDGSLTSNTLSELLPESRKHLAHGSVAGKSRRPQSGGWKSLFQLGRGTAGGTRRRDHRDTYARPTSPDPTTFRGRRRSERGSLRSAKSEESLSSSQDTDADVTIRKPRRPRSSNDVVFSALPLITDPGPLDPQPDLSDHSESTDKAKQNEPYQEGGDDEDSFIMLVAGGNGGKIDFDPISYKFPESEVVLEVESRDLSEEVFEVSSSKVTGTKTRMTPGSLQSKVESAEIMTSAGIAKANPEIEVCLTYKEKISVSKTSTKSGITPVMVAVISPKLKPESTLSENSIIQEVCPQSSSVVIGSNKSGVCDDADVNKETIVVPSPLGSCARRKNLSPQSTVFAKSSTSISHLNIQQESTNVGDLEGEAGPPRPPLPVAFSPSLPQQCEVSSSGTKGDPENIEEPPSSMSSWRNAAPDSQTVASSGWQSGDMTNRFVTTLGTRPLQSFNSQPFYSVNKTQNSIHEVGSVQIPLGRLEDSKRIARSLPVSRTEVPPVQDPYMPRARQSRSAFPTGKEVYFENGRVHYRQTSRSGNEPFLAPRREASFHGVGTNPTFPVRWGQPLWLPDVCGHEPDSFRHVRAFSIRDGFLFVEPAGTMPLQAPPLSFRRERSFAGRECHHNYYPLYPDSIAALRNTPPRYTDFSTQSCDYPPPMPTHLRSRSDPGRFGLVPTEPGVWRVDEDPEIRASVPLRPPDLHNAARMKQAWPPPHYYPEALPFVASHHRPPSEVMFFHGDHSSNRQRRINTAFSVHNIGTASSSVHRRCPSQPVHQLKQDLAHCDLHPSSIRSPLLTSMRRRPPLSDVFGIYPKPGTFSPPELSLSRQEAKVQVDL